MMTKQTLLSAFVGLLLAFETAATSTSTATTGPAGGWNRANPTLLSKNRLSVSLFQWQGNDHGRRLTPLALRGGFGDGEEEEVQCVGTMGTLETVERQFEGSDDNAVIMQKIQQLKEMYPGGYRRVKVLSASFLRMQCAAV
eukprot:2984895-Rhodomonas_salina.3